MKRGTIRKCRQRMAAVAYLILNCLFAPTAFASGGDGGYQNAGEVASTIYSNFAQIAQLITAGAYIGGLAFAVGAIMKFKQHKDNPTQVPIGTPIAMTMLAACLLFLPSILGTAGETIFGGGTTADSTGVAWSSGG